MQAQLGELALVGLRDRQPILAEVVGFSDGDAQLMPYEAVQDVRPDATVRGLNRRFSIPVGPPLLGRVINGMGEPIDGLGKLQGCVRVSVQQDVPSSLDRPKITQPLVTGQRVIDGFLTCGLGQRVSLLAGSGVGKSTLLGEIAKSSNADINVVALIGERGREVRPFLDDCLGAEGLAKSITIVATAEQPALLRVRAAQAAVTCADAFRRQGKHVLLMLDSVTRLATAQREIGLLMGEPPSARGFTPSVFQQLSHLLEQLGNSGSGSITGILTVLVDGDDLDEPVTDAVRATVDGHIVLDRQLAEQGHYPAVNIAKSISRVFLDVTSPEHQQFARKLRAAMATYDDIVDLVRVGAYVNGTSPSIDTAIRLKPEIDAMVRQDIGDFSAMQDTLRTMESIARRWPY